MEATFSTDWLELPSKETWEARRQWFEALGDSFVAKGGSYGLSDQACALVGEVQVAFCSGAWVTVLVMVMTVVEAHLRDFGYSEFVGNTEKLLRAAGVNPALDGLRKRRNSIVHFQEDHPGITLDQQWLNRTQLETEAKEAVRLMFEVFYSDVGT